MNSLQLVAEYGAMAIPGVGQAVDAGMSECQPPKQTLNPQDPTHLTFSQLPVFKRRNWPNTRSTLLQTP